MRLDKIIAVRTDKTVYKDGGNAIKIFNNNYSKSDILNEALNLARAWETGLNVPELLEVTKIDGKPAIITKFIPGKTLAQLLEENPEKIDEYINMFIGVQKQIFSKNARSFVGQKEKMRFEISESGLNAELKRTLCEKLEKMPKDNRLCHGDFNPENIVITNGGEPYILDWPHAVRGNEAADAAWSYLLFLMSGNTGAAKTYLDLLGGNAETSYIKQYIPIAAAAHLVQSNARERGFLIDFIEPN